MSLSLLEPLMRPKGALKAVIIIILVVLMVYMQCAVPVMESHALAAEAAIAYGIVSLLTILGIKLIPTATKSIADYMKDIYNSAGEDSTLKKYITGSINSGDIVKIPSADLTAIRGEVESSLGLDYQSILGVPKGDRLTKPVIIDNISYADVSISVADMINGGVTIPYTPNTKISILNTFLVPKSDGVPPVYYAKNYTIDCLTPYNCNYEGDLYYRSNNQFSMSTNVRLSASVPGPFVFIKFFTADYVLINKYNTSNLLGATFTGFQVGLINEVGQLGYVTSLNNDYIAMIDVTGTLDISGVSGTIVSTKGGIKIIGGVAQTIQDYYDKNNEGIIPVKIPDNVTPKISEVLPIPADYPDEVLPDLPLGDDLTAYDDTPVGTWDETNDKEITDVKPGEGTGEGTVPSTELGELPTVPDLTLPDIISTKFPFSIPWDVKRAVEVMVSAPEVPHWEVPFKIPSANINETVEIDFSQFETLAVITRWFSVAIVTIGLIFATRKLIGQ